MPHIEFIARALVTDGSRLLLCRDVAAGYYYLPGGHVDFGEPATTAVERELMEEGAITARAGKCLIVHENVFEARGRTHHEVNVVFHVTLVSPATDQIVSKEPQIALEWIETAALADIDLRPRALAAWLASGARGEDVFLSTIDR